MDIKTLKQFERKFLKEYPGGFEHPEMLEIAKKHKMDKLINLAQSSFSENAFNNPLEICSSMVKMISSSSLVSIFEKPKFRDFIKSLPKSKKKQLSEALHTLLYVNQKVGFEEYLAILTPPKLARWTMISVIPAYFRPKKDLFIKPTTTKNIISELELPLKYSPRPTWGFYKKYRSEILRMKKQVNKSLTPNNAAFTGFLMISTSAEFIN